MESVTQPVLLPGWARPALPCPALLCPTLPAPGKTSHFPGPQNHTLAPPLLVVRTQSRETSLFGLLMEKSEAQSKSGSNSDENKSCGCTCEQDSYGSILYLLSLD